MNGDNHSYIESIQLSDEYAFRNVKNAKRFAIDIGGSLTKIAYRSTVTYRKVIYNSDNPLDHPDDAYHEVSERERLHFIKFETKYIEQCLDFIKEHLVDCRSSMLGKSIKATGGGAHKYQDLIFQKLGLTIEKEDEIECLIKGCNFLLRNIPDEQFTYSKNEDPEYRFVNSNPDVFPYLLVNIGSGVSIMKVEGEDKYERIGGTCMGGGTFWGLGSLLTKAKKFDDLLQLASEGDHRNVDLLVKDIYGGDYAALGLSGDVIASSFAKAMVGRQTEFNEADLARSLLFTVSNNIGLLASLYSMNHKLTKVYFGGYFLRNHPASMHSISYAVNYWNKGQVQALFLRHEGFLGAIGAYLKGTEENDIKYSWGENYAGSSGLQSPLPTPFKSSGPSIDQLEMDRCDQQLANFPLLAHPQDYVPDTVDLILDRAAREYWVSCFENSLDSFVKRAIDSVAEKSDDDYKRAEQFRQKYLQRLKTLHHHPFAYGHLTVRSLLDMREHCLNEFDFTDPYRQQKKDDNAVALAHLKDHLAHVDSLPWVERQESLVENLLAGNMFDWGAQEMMTLLDGKISFFDARDKLEKRPWLEDDLTSWIARLRRVPHQCALIFLDNSGFDLIMGVIPFARELIIRGTKVILCANSKPAVNDVTHGELEIIFAQVVEVCPILKKALNEEKLKLRPSGQSSPCLDLSRLPRSLVEEVLSMGCDLIVLTGMGRAVHTNLNAKLTCDTLKLAVIKNKWLAERLGGGMFAVLCKFEPRISSTSCSPDHHGTPPREVEKKFPSKNLEVKKSPSPQSK